MSHELVDYGRKLYEVFENKLVEISETVSDHGDPLIAAWNEYLKTIPVTLGGHDEFPKDKHFIFNPLYTDHVNRIIVMEHEFAEKVMILGLP